MLAIIRLFAVLAFIVVLIRTKRLHLGIVMLAATVFAAVLFWMSPQYFFTNLFGELIGAKSITFIVIIVLVVMLSQVMESAGYFRQMVEGIAGVLPSRRLRLAVLPAMIGLLPMPGGAIFSAPMVGRAGEGLPLDRHLKGAINFWFRHVWEFCWPLYPGVIAYANELARLDITLSQVLPLQAILTPTMLLVGIFFLFPRKLGPRNIERDVGQWGRRLAKAVVPAVPVVIVVACFVGLGPVVHALYSAAGGGGVEKGGCAETLLNRAPFILGLLASIAYVVLKSGRNRPDVLRSVTRNPRAASMGLMAVGIVAFGATVGSENAAGEAGQFFRETGVVLPVVLVLPFILGLVTGITIAYVVTAFPLIVHLLDTGINPLPYLVVAFASGFIGVMLSPAHLCLLVSRQYFKADLMRMYRYLAAPALGMAVAVAVLFLLLKWLL